MPISIPNLDVLNFNQLVEKLRQDIPKLSRQWTDYNLSDPGITLMELLVWVSETLAYRLNRPPAVTFRDFLYLLAGASYRRLDLLLAEIALIEETEPYLDPDYKHFLEYLKLVSEEAKPNVAQMRANAVRYFHKPFLALTQQDFETLAMQTNEILGDSPLVVGKAIVSNVNEVVVVGIVPIPHPEKGFSFGDETLYGEGTGFRYRGTVDPRYSSQVEADPNFQKALDDLLEKVRQFLAVRTLLGCAVRVEPVLFSPVAIQVWLTLNVNLNLKEFAEMLKDFLLQWLNPLIGGPQGKGWPINQLPTQPKLVSQLLKLKGILSVDQTQVKVLFETSHLNSRIKIPEGMHSFRGLPSPSIELNMVKPESTGR